MEMKNVNTTANMKLELVEMTIPAPQTMVLAAFEYCLGRRTYVVSDCVEWLLDNIQSLPISTLQIMLRCINEREDRQALGDDCDIAQWYRLRSRINDKLHGGVSFTGVTIPLNGGPV
jgi:hypothetical protein